VAGGDRLEISFDEPSGRVSSPARGGGINKLLVAALVITLLAFAGVVFAYINLLSDRVAVSPEQIDKEERIEQEQIIASEPEKEQTPDEPEPEPEPETVQLETGNNEVDAEAPAEVETTAAGETQQASSGNLPALSEEDKVRGEWMYRQEYGDIFKRKLDEFSNRGLAEAPEIVRLGLGTHFGIAGDWVYYISGDKLFRVRLDGTAKQPVGNWSDYYSLDRVKNQYVPK